MNNNYNLPLYTEVVDNLWLGGTADGDAVFDVKRSENMAITDKLFDTVITLYAWANAAGWGVKELRYGFYDADMKDIDLETIEYLVDVAYDDWKNKGKRLLIRCQMGYNRSSFIFCQVLMRDGYTAKDAINLMREKRSEWVLCNKVFEKWLLELDSSKRKVPHGESESQTEMKHSP